ncbi:hypothetical protein [Halorussus caseinilyticus]|uniref:C2H2-type domain-containing protein n=1 Tax=Halorussus caseinilyticus TaxID=3034025 RepID=A0ABD5WLW9_9EURY|nr:hypothetical protein [Halorussus sp. DT72]
MSNTPFRDRMYRCAQCSRDVRVRSVFGHYEMIHDESLVTRARDGTDSCTLCRMELPPADANDAWKLRVRHFRDHHGKRLVDTDAVR